MRFRSAVFALLAATVAVTQAQSGTNASPTPSQLQPNGTITGHVFCADTSRPARFARVSLQPVSDPNKAKPNYAPLSSTKAAPETTMLNSSVDTALDGSFTLTHVKPGHYYVIVRKDGYINPAAMFSGKELANPTDQIRALMDEVLPRIQLEQDATAHAEIQLQRGAAVSGTVLYDDGTPASAMYIRLLHKDQNGKWAALKSNSMYYDPRISTDDRGRYRLASLLPDTYLLQADMNLAEVQNVRLTDSAGSTSESGIENFRSSISFFGEGTPHQSQAAGFTLRSGEERTGQDMTLPIGKLHRLTGRVATGPNGHLVNAASIELFDGVEKQSISSTDIRREDGLFQFEFVPEGNYTLRVRKARDVTWEPSDAKPGTWDAVLQPDKEHLIQAYGDAEIPLSLTGDMLGITINVPEKQSSKTAPAN